MTICENCHPRWETNIQTIHNTHLDFGYLTINRSGVECKLCHATPQGYNSSIVQVPPFPGADKILIGEINRPNWEGECSFCHFTIRGAERVHDIHEPVILKECPICHSKHILDSEAMFKRAGVPFPEAEEHQSPPTLEDKIISIVETNETLYKHSEKPSPALPLGSGTFLSEFYLYFDGILEEFIDIYSLLV